MSYEEQSPAAESPEESTEACAVNAPVDNDVPPAGVSVNGRLHAFAATFCARLRDISDAVRYSAHPTRQWALLATAAIFLAAAIYLGVDALLYRGICRHVTAELGCTQPEVTMFISGDDSAKFESVPEIDENTPGKYRLTLLTSRGRRRVTFTTVDTSAPYAESSRRTISTEMQPEPIDMLDSVFDYSPVTASWVTMPAFGEIGVYMCDVRLTDEYGNSAVYSTEIEIVSPIAPLTLEIMSPVPAAQDFFSFPTASPAEYVDNALLDLTAVGEYPVTLSADGKEYSTYLYVVDSTPPSASPAPQSTYTGYTLDAGSFVTGISDCSAVTVAFEAEPDWFLVGTQTVTVRLTDEYGNFTLLDSSLTISADTVPPVISCLEDIYLYVGEPVSYYSNVFVSDDIDSDPEISVDKSQVDFRTAGEYPVTYTATDKAGNTSSLTVTFHFLEARVSMEKLSEMGQEILAKIITDDMTDAEKLKAMQNYVYGTIHYTSMGVSRTDWRYAAYYTIKNNIGDCYGTSSVLYLLMTEAGFDALIIERASGKSYTHFWCMVKVDGNWYHIDATRINYWRIPRMWCFLKTTDELYTLEWGRHYWDYDTSLYPQTPDEPYSGQ